jgi:hypothetical protein
LLDLGMLGMADVAIRPAHGELHEQGISFPVAADTASAVHDKVARLLVTALPGVLGGEEVVVLLRNAIADEVILVTQR